jgi:hypothetical protein
MVTLAVIFDEPDSTDTEEPRRNRLNDNTEKDHLKEHVTRLWKGVQIGLCLWLLLVHGIMWIVFARMHLSKSGFS